MASVDRHSIEKRIYDLSRGLKKNPSTNCNDEEMTDQFLAAWQELAEYFVTSEDTEIGVTTVREYLRWAHTFGAYAQSELVSANCREISVQTRDELSGFIDDILVAVADKLNLPD